MIDRLGRVARSERLIARATEILHLDARKLAFRHRAHVGGRESELGGTEALTQRSYFVWKAIEAVSNADDRGCARSERVVPLRGVYLAIQEVPRWCCRGPKPVLIGFG